ncbi:hypothetical protein BKA00_006426 [Actinomadura coerulea]|uniref:Uncharacterized protein n=1 Tax=Actinomadura coerulea TaxID=46159 RepID=A0A7X0L2G7_9ACTN|nr:hypothetical protein [Actinomadura coerulea]MBB6399512.1 hypothetical protein [Actinomadura coerulea]GGQ13196.1 hypothetical protein GCM10010187_31920 [Actinomadura coerulea]
MANGKKDAMRRRRTKRLAERAERFERHAALVNQRSGDPRYVHHVANPDGSVTLTPAVSDVDDFQDVVEKAAQQFRAKFGREIGPDAPVSFDPDADEPVPIDEQKMVAEVREQAERMDGPVMRMHMLAFAEFGYVVAEMNQHAFSAHEVDAYWMQSPRTLADSESARPGKSRRDRLTCARASQRDPEPSSHSLLGPLEKPSLMERTSIERRHRRNARTPR